MNSGTPIQRQWVVVLRNGAIAIDWGEGLFQDIDSGECMSVDTAQISHTAQNSDLDMLRRSGRVHRYDAIQAWFINLPQRPARWMD